MLRLGNGEFESEVEGAVPPSVHHARNYFLEVVRQLVPDVLRDLNDRAFDIYQRTGLYFDEAAHEERLKNLNLYDRIREISRLRYAHMWNYPDWATHFEDGAITYDENLMALQHNIFEWSHKWNLNEIWCRERAYQTLDYWCSSPMAHKNLVWKDEPAWETIVAFRRGEHPAFFFEYRTLYPREGHREYVERRITEAFKEQLKSFLDSREKMAKDAGMRPTPKKREKLHFEWLVCFQVKGMSYNEVLRKYFPRVYEAAINRGDVGDRTKRIRKAVNEVSRLINLPLRSDGVMPGRRPARKLKSELSSRP